MVSVIVPVYNVKKYLVDCVGSITGQSYKDLEIILVNDGSTDRSGELCDTLAKSDGRIKVIHRQNGGLMSAWQSGVEEARGEYIGFVDSDDEIAPDMYERLVETMEKDGSDIVVSGLVREYPDRSEKETFYLEGGLYLKEDIREKIFPIMLSNGNMLNRGLSPNRVTKLFRKDILLRNIPYCDKRISLGEDLVTTFATVLDAERISIIDDYFPYKYKIRSSSIMGAYNPVFQSQSFLLNDAVRSIALKKQAFDFEEQLANDLVSLIYYGMEKCAFGGPDGIKGTVRYIKDFMNNEKFKKAFGEETLSQNNKKCFIYKALLKMRFYLPLSFLAGIVGKKRFG